MPIYEYEGVSAKRKCKKCASVFEMLQPISAPPLAACPECGGAVRRRISRPQVILPGSARGDSDVEKKIADFERQGMHSHAAELADREGEKPERSQLKERAMDNYRKAGYDF